MKVVIPSYIIYIVSIYVCNGVCLQRFHIYLSIWLIRCCCRSNRIIAIVHRHNRNLISCMSNFPLTHSRPEHHLYHHDAIRAMYPARCHQNHTQHQIHTLYVAHAHGMMDDPHCLWVWVRCDAPRWWSFRDVSRVRRIGARFDYISPSLRWVFEMSNNNNNHIHTLTAHEGNYDFFLLLLDFTLIWRK